MLETAPVQRARRTWSLLVELVALCSWLVSTTQAQAPAGDDEVIADPELRATEAESSPSVGARSEQSGQVRVVLRSRLGIDTRWEDAREDVLEATQIALFEARIRRSERLRFEIGVRARYLFATRQHATPDADAGRYELDAVPTAAFANATVVDGLHLRLGYQSVHLGRFDVLNPSDVLSAYDQRSGLVTMPEAAEIAQPAIRVDWDAASWLSLKLIALPFFQPNVVRGFDGDYALSPSKQADVNAAYMSVLPNADDARQVQGVVRRTLSRTGQARLAETGLSAFAPEASLHNPQAALRLNAHGPAGELALTAAIAREHLPALRFSDSFLAYAQNNTQATQDAFFNDKHPAIDVGYDRFEIVSIDGATALGPVQLGAEVAYMFHRTLLAAEQGQLALPEHSDMAHFGVRLEYEQGRTWVVVIEASAERALATPSDPKRRFMFMTPDRWLFASVGFLAFSPGDVGLTLELGGGVLSGPSYVLAPRVEQRLLDGFYLETGASFIDGKQRPLDDPGVSLGGLYRNTNQVFIGVRWQP